MRTCVQVDIQTMISTIPNMCQLITGSLEKDQLYLLHVISFQCGRIKMHIKRFQQAHILKNSSLTGCPKYQELFALPKQSQDQKST